MRFDLITIFPEMFNAISECGITRRAIEQKIIDLHFWNPRQYSQEPHQRVDERPYGGGPGMVMQVEPLRAAIHAARQADEIPATCIYLSPQGKPLQQDHINHLAQTQPRLILLCGRYEGIDQRIIDYDIDEEWSIGDYVLSGGELPAMILIDAITRLLPNALGHHQSASLDSFMQGLLDYPHYTRPPLVDNQTVPEVLLSGDHQAIEKFRLKQQLLQTYQKRPDLLQKRPLSPELQKLLEDALQEFKKMV